MIGSMITLSIRKSQLYKHIELIKYNYKLFTNTVEPLNNGHFGTSNFWHNFTVIERLSSLRGKIVLP